MSVLSSAFALFALAFAYHAAADRNVTVDDTSSDIRYSGEWTTSATTELDHGGTHQLTEDHSATAKLTFTGNAVYYMSPKWPYTVNAAVSVDGGQVTLIDLIDHGSSSQDGGPETTASEVVWARTGLDNGEHTLTISVGGGQQYAIVDAIIYTVQDEETTTSAAATSTQEHTSQTAGATQTTSSESEPSTTQVGAASDHKKNTATIAASVTVAVVGMLAVALTFFCMSRRKRRQQSGSLLHHSPTFEKYPPDADYGTHAELNYLSAVSPASSNTFIGSQGFPSPSDGPKYAHYPQFSPTVATHDPIPDASSTSAAPHPYAVAPATPAPLTTAQLQEAFRNHSLQSDPESMGAWPSPILPPQPPTQVSSSYNPAPSAYVPPSGVHRLSTITEMSSIASLQPSMQSLQSAAAPSSSVQPLQPPAALRTDANRLSAAPSEHDLPYLSASPTHQSFRLSGGGAAGGHYAESSGGASDSSAGHVSNVSVPQDAVNPTPTPKRTHSIKRVPPPVA